MAKTIPSQGDPVRTDPQAATKAADNMMPSMPMLKTPERSEADSPIADKPDRHAEPYSRGKNAGNE